MQRKSGKSREEMTFQHVSSPFNTTIWSKKLKSNLNNQGEYRERSLEPFNERLTQKWAAWCKESWGNWEKKWLSSTFHHHSISQFGQKNSSRIWITKESIERSLKPFNEQCRNGLLDAKKVGKIERRNDFPARFIAIQYHNFVKKIPVEFE